MAIRVGVGKRREPRVGRSMVGWRVAGGTAVDEGVVDEELELLDAAGRSLRVVEHAEERERDLIVPGVAAEREREWQWGGGECGGGNGAEGVGGVAGRRECAAW